MAALFCIAAAVILALAVGSIRETESVATPTPAVLPTEVPTAESAAVTPHPIGRDGPTDGGLGPEIFLPCEFPGTVETVTYTTRDYGGTGEVSKNMRVYIPYGYSEENQYNVLVLLHGYGGSENYWFDEIRWYNDPDYGTAYEGRVQNILDNMIANELCDPLIVVSPTYYLCPEWRETGDIISRDGTQFASELANDILPAIAADYATYAKSPDRESIAAAREHFAFLGASNGAVIGSSSVLPNDLDMLAYYGLVSGYETTAYRMQERWNALGYAEHDIGYVYFSAGEDDFLRGETEAGYLDMKQNCSKIGEDNIGYTKIRGVIHEDAVWLDAIYNCLLLFYQ